MDTVERLKEYVAVDKIYQDYKKGKEPAHNDGNTDFEWFCIEHCRDIETLIALYQNEKSHTETLTKLLEKTKEEILNEITSFCNECSSRECCPEEECVLFRIEQIITK